MPRNDFDDDRERKELNAIERDRYDRRMHTKRKSLITNILLIAVVAAVVIGAIVLVVSLTSKNKNTDNTEPTAISATIASETQNSETTAKENSQQPTSANGQSSSQNDSQQDATQPVDPALRNSSSSSSDGSSSSSAASSGSSSSAGSSSADGGGALHYYANGQTSYGYDWTYSGYGVNVNCSYNFDTHQYDFSLTGISEGTYSVTLYYNTADGVQQAVPMTVYVDSNLNVTQVN